MKKLTNITALLLWVCTISLSQTQMNNWYMGPKKINMTVSAPVPATITPVIGTATAATAGHVANGFYDNSGTGNMLFYIADGAVYDYNNTLIGNFPNGGAEVAIVPFGNNSSCQKKYNIFSTSGGITSPTALWQTVLDMNSYSLSTVNPPLGMQYGTEFGAIAVGKVFGAALDRYIYFMAASGTVGTTGGQIYKAVIHNDGSVSPSVLLYPKPAIGVTNSNAGGEVFSKELELSPDGKWLAWASYAQGNFGGGFPTQNRYHFVALNSTGDLDVASYGTVNVYQQFNITGANYNLNNTGFRGIEFYKGASGTKLFMGAGADGIYSTDIAIPFAGSFTQVSFSNGTTATSFGFSQIELANNGYMYAASTAGGGGTNIGAFLPSNPAPSIFTNQPSFPLTNPPKDVYTLGGANPNSTLYTLPDQIDGQNYSTIVQPPVAPITTTNSVNFNAGTGTWMSGSGSNPWNLIGINPVVQVVKELRVSASSNLTIKGMTFKFSPEAKVIIEPGSTLTLDHLNGTPTVFTSDYLADPCLVAYTWIGAEVWGNSNASQNTLPLAQGKLTVKNNSRIEYAKWGARIWDGIFTNKAGGIINVTTGGNFKNCRTGVEFKPYQNFVGTTLVGNKSSFINAAFDNNQYYPFAAAPQHVTIDGCTGILFSACIFTNDNSVPMFTLQSMGIKSLNSSFTVSNNSQFNNLWHGIDAKRTGGVTTFGVYNTIFTDNQTGIYTDNVNNFTAQLNTFNIGGNAKPGATTQLGPAP